MMPRTPSPDRPASHHEPLPGFHRGMQTLQGLKSDAQRSERVSERVADFFTRLSGTMTFVAIHAGWFVVWTVWNLGLVPGLRPFDPFPFGLLTMVVSLEAIFLSTFVLVSQNREERVNAVRDEIQTQIALYEEQELTQLLRMVHRIEKHLGLKDEDERMVRSMEHFVDADDLFREIEQIVMNRRGQEGAPGPR